VPVNVGDAVPVLVKEGVNVIEAVDSDRVVERVGDVVLERVKVGVAVGDTVEIDNVTVEAVKVWLGVKVLVVVKVIVSESVGDGVILGE